MWSSECYKTHANIHPRYYVASSIWLWKSKGLQFGQYKLPVELKPELAQEDLMRIDGHHCRWKNEMLLLLQNAARRILEQLKKSCGHTCTDCSFVLDANYRSLLNCLATANANIRQQRLRPNPIYVSAGLSESRRCK